MSSRPFLIFIIVPTLIALFSSMYKPQGMLFERGDLENDVDSAQKSPRRILLLTAHPDDECMFFAPTILGLITHEVFSLCLSIGNADGAGQIRQKELGQSLDVLRVAPHRRWVLERPFEDNITQYWDAKLVAQHVKPYVLDNHIDVILTFDHRGISSHPNHISLARGASTLLADALFQIPSVAEVTKPPVRRLQVFTLKTVGLAQKYTGQVAVVLEITKIAVCMTPFGRAFASYCEAKRRLTFISGFGEYVTALRAMMRHRSQLVWFRWLYVMFSRYMWVNNWVEMVREAEV